MTRSRKDDEWYQTIEEVCRQLAADGLIYDTGERRWSPRTKSYQVVWVAVPPKDKQS
jgi:hypothetical protein